MISENQRLQYLAAMGVDAWVSRARAARSSQVVMDPAPVAPVNDGQPATYFIGPGSGQTLVLCRSQEEASSRLASDIARCLDEVPVWGWVAQEAPGPESPGIDLQTAIRDRLFTRVLVFDAAVPVPGGAPAVIGSARVLQAPALADLANSSQHKRRLWSQLVSNGWCRRFD